MGYTLPPDATADEGITNEERASWAEVVLVAFSQRTGAVSDWTGTDKERSLVLTDLLADLAHWCDRNNVDMQAAIQRARNHYQTETGSEGIQLGLTN